MACLLTSLGVASDAGACSCAPVDLRTKLRSADAAFVGKAVEVHESAGSRTYVFEVEIALKGELPGRIAVSVGGSGTSCDMGFQLGTRAGMVMSAWEGGWSSGLCHQADPDALIAAAAPLPRADPDRYAAVVVGGSSPPNRLAALDVRGRVVSYGRGSGQTTALAVCPGGHTLLETVYRRGGSFLAVRTLPGLRLQREQYLHPSWYFGGVLVCGDAEGRSAIAETYASVHAIDETGLRTVASGGEQRAIVTAAGPLAYAVTGAGDRIRSIDARTGRVRIAARGLQGVVVRLAASPDGSALAALVRTDAGTNVVSIDLRSGRRHVASWPDLSDQGTLTWVGPERLLVHGRTDRVVDKRLRPRSAHASWAAGKQVVLAAARLFAIAGSRLLSATVAGGDVRVSWLPGDQLSVLVGLPPTLRG